MSTYNLPDTLERDMHKNAERERIRSYQGEVATPRTFQKTGIYIATELKTRWRKTIWDDVPSLMGDERRIKCS